MPLLDIRPPDTLSSDIRITVAALATTMHELPADNKGGPVGPHESARTGKFFVDSVNGDTLGLTWAFRRGSTWHRAATVELTFGHAGRNKFRGTSVLTRGDGSQVIRGSDNDHSSVAAAATELIGRLVDDQWATLAGHLWYEADTEAAAEAAAARYKRAILWVANLSTLVFLIHMVATRGDYHSLGKDIVDLTDVACLFGIAGAAILVIGVLNSRAIHLAYKLQRQAMLRLTKH